MMTALLPLLAVISQQERIDFVSAVAPVPQVVKELSRKTGMTLSADPEMEKDIVFVSVRHASIEDIKVKLALAAEGIWSGDTLVPDVDKREKSRVSDLAACRKMLQDDVDRMNRIPELQAKVLAASSDKKSVQEEFSYIHSFLRCMNELHPVMLAASDQLDFGQEVTLREGYMTVGYPAIDWSIIKDDETIIKKIGRGDTLELRIRRLPLADRRPVTYTILSNTGKELVGWGEWDLRVTCKGFRSREVILPGELRDDAWKFLCASADEVSLMQRIETLKSNDLLDLIVGDYLKSYSSLHQVNIIACISDDADEFVWSINDDAQFELDGELEIPGQVVAKEGNWITVSPEYRHIARGSRADRQKLKSLVKMHPSYPLAGWVNGIIDNLENPQ